MRQASDADILAAPFTFQSAQRVVAREYGYANWSELVQAVDSLRQAETAMVAEVERCLRAARSIHVLVPEHLADEVAEHLTRRFNAQELVCIHRSDRIDNEGLLGLLDSAKIVVGGTDSLGFSVMYERLQGLEECPLARTLGRAHAFVNTPRRDERTPLVISGPDDAGEVHDLATMEVTELFGLYESFADHRY